MIIELLILAGFFIQSAIFAKRLKYLIFRIVSQLLNIVWFDKARTTVGHFVFVLNFGACECICLHSNFRNALNNLECTQ